LALISGFSFDQFHSDVLRFFVPRRLFSSLKQHLLCLLQRADESFLAYIFSIREAALLLKFPVSEKEIIDNILDGLTPAQRSRFGFQVPPSSWADINSQCMTNRNISLADSNRQLEGSMRCAITPIRQLFNKNTGRNASQVSNVGPE
jgi:hypothetical protein